MDYSNYIQINNIEKLCKIDSSYIIDLCNSNKIHYKNINNQYFIAQEDIDIIKNEYDTLFNKKLKRLPIGISDFKELIDRNYYYVDKTLLIEQLLDAGDKVSLFTRPRRFGKTLTMSMLKTFFEKTDNDTSSYFKETKIWQAGERYISEQGKYNVIYLTLKDVRAETWDELYKLLTSQIQQKYGEFEEYILSSKNINRIGKDYFEKIETKTADITEFKESLFYLSDLLYKATHIKSIIIIDEYDTPIQTAYTNGYYSEAIDFLKTFLSMGLKDNQALEKGFISGILQVNKESIFSGLNNLKVYSLFDNKRSEFFGFTTEEVREMLHYYHRGNCINEVLDWYDGYLFGNNEIINPWSILNYLTSDCNAKEYWANTSSNDLITDITPKLQKDDFNNLCSLMNGQSIETELDRNITYLSINDKTSNIYSYLLAAGYLTISKQNDRTYDVKLPNKEIRNIYETEVLYKAEKTIGRDLMHEITNALEKNNIPVLQKSINKYIAQSVSFYDSAYENFYHGLILGMCVIEYGKYWIKSNREAGKGRFDICLEPINKENNAIIIEVKQIQNTTSKEDLHNKAQEALKQIEEKSYCSELLSKGIKHINTIGMAFCSKEVEIVGKNLENEREDFTLETDSSKDELDLEDKNEKISLSKDANLFESDFYEKFNNLIDTIYNNAKSNSKLIENNKYIRDFVKDFEDYDLSNDFTREALIKTINSIGIELISSNLTKTWNDYLKIHDHLIDYHNCKANGHYNNEIDISSKDTIEKDLPERDENERDGPEL